jgi:hypothetical protein
VKAAFIAIVLVGAASVLAHLHVVAQTYYPVVQVASPDGLVFTAVHDATSERAACATANDEFLAPFKSLCRDCKVVAARCERELGGFDPALTLGKALPHHLVSAPGLQLAIAGPDEIARVTCDHIARAASGRNVRCLPPLRPAKS